MKALELGRSYGWKPMGTRPPSIHEFYKLGADWDGAYLTNDGQVIKAEDALSLALALEKALDDIPDDSIEMDWNPRFWVEDELPEWLSPEEKAMIEDGLEGERLDMLGIHPFEYFAGEEKYYLTQFIRFCKLGSFVVL